MFASPCCSACSDWRKPGGMGFCGVALEVSTSNRRKTRSLLKGTSRRGGEANFTTLAASGRTTIHRGGPCRMVPMSFRVPGVPHPSKKGKAPPPEETFEEAAYLKGLGEKQK